MAVNGFTNIVTDGLVLSLDAGNLKSYPTTGTTWTDLSRNGNNGTLTGTITFSSSTAGILIFGGGYISLNQNVLLNLNSVSNWSIDTWVYRTGLGTSFRSDIIGIDTTGNINSTIMAISNAGSFFIGGDGGVNMNPIVSASQTISLNTWYHLAAVKNGTNIKLYVNGVEGASQTRSNFNWSDLGVTAKIANRVAGDVQFLGRIPILNIYRNKALSASEVLQNYNATKWRFI
jgi:hypothetical protein